MHATNWYYVIVSNWGNIDVLRKCYSVKYSTLTKQIEVVCEIFFGGGPSKVSLEAMQKCDILKRNT